MLRPIRHAFARRVLDAYKRRKQRSAVVTPDHALAVARAMLERTKYCFLITRSSDGSCSARLVEPIVDKHDPFVLWFGTNPTLRKVREIEADPRVTIAVEDERERANLVLYGTAHIERDVNVRRKRWVGLWRLFFPQGPTGDDYVVIRFEAERMEVMSFRRNIVAEPFGLRPLVLVRRGAWEVIEAVAATRAAAGSADVKIPP